MTSHTRVTLECDGHDCLTEITEATHRISVVEQRARTKGWAIRGDHHYCPEHAP